jgi:ribosome recycling factor
VKVLKDRTEEAKIAIRNIRRNGNKDLKDFTDEKLISEDDQKRGEERIQKLTDEHIAKLDELAKAKEEEITEV